MSERWVVTGASGFLGYHMCKFLVKKRVKCIGVDINPFEFEDLKGKVEFYRADIRDFEKMKEITRGADVIMHGAAALPRWPKDKIWDVNVNGTKTLLEAALTNRVPRFIFISTTAVYGIPRVHPIAEDYPLTGVGPYGESKVAAERLCEEYRKKGLIVSILRPKTFVGSVRLGIFSILFDWVYRGKNIPIIGSGNNRYQLLDVDDLVEAIWLVAHAPPEIANDVYNVGAEKFGTIRTHVQTLLDYRGRGRIIPLPALPIKIALRILEKLGLSPLYEWAYETVDKDHYVSIEKIKKKLGWKPRKSSEEALLDSYRWYEKHRKDVEGKRGVTHTAQWDEGVLGIIRDLFF